MRIYHAVENWDGGDILSLERQYGYNDAVTRFEQRWPDGCAAEHVQLVHCYDNLADAINHAREFGCAQVLEIDTAAGGCELDVRIDTVEDGCHHPVVQGKIAANYIVNVHEVTTK